MTHTQAKAPCARSLQECLLIQLEKSRGDSIATQLAMHVLMQCFEAFTKKHYDKIAEQLGLEKNKEQPLEQMQHKRKRQPSRLARNYWRRATHREAKPRPMGSMQQRKQQWPKKQWMIV